MTIQYRTLDSEVQAVTRYIALKTSGRLSQESDLCLIYNVFMISFFILFIGAP